MNQSINKHMNKIGQINPGQYLTMTHFKICLNSYSYCASLPSVPCGLPFMKKGWSQSLKARQTSYIVRIVTDVDTLF